MKRRLNEEELDQYFDTRIQEDSDVEFQKDNSYNSKLIEYMVAINNNYKETINDPKFQKIKQEIIEVVKQDNEKIFAENMRLSKINYQNLSQDRLVEEDEYALLGSIDEDESILHNSEDEQMNEENLMYQPNKKDYRPIPESLFNMNGGTNFTGNFSNELAEINQSLNDINIDIETIFTKIKNYVERTDYYEYLTKSPLNYIPVGPNLDIMGIHLQFNLTADILCLILDIPTLTPNTKEYMYNMTWLLYLIVEFNSKYTIGDHKDVYDKARCNYGFIPGIDDLSRNCTGNCKHISALSYLYLSNPDLIHNIITNEITRIGILSSSILNDGNLNVMRDHLFKLSSEIKKLKPSVLFVLALVILNKRSYNVYNSTELITYDQLKQSVFFNKVIQNKYTRNSFSNLPLSVAYNEMPLLSRLRFKWEKLQSNSLYATRTKIKLYITNAATFNFIHDSPFIIGIYKLGLSSGHALLLNPRGNNKYQIIDPNYSNQNIEESKLTFGYHLSFINKQTYIEMTIDDDLLKIICESMKTSIESYVTDLKDTILIEPLLITYKNTYNNLVLNNGMKMQYEFSCKPDDDLIGFKTIKKKNIRNCICHRFIQIEDKIYLYHDQTMKEIKMDRICSLICKYNAISILYDVTDSRINKKYLYIGDYMWVDCDNPNVQLLQDPNLGDTRITHPYIPFIINQIGLFYLNKDISDRINDISNINGVFLSEEEIEGIEYAIDPDKIEGSSNTLLSKIKSILFTYNSIIILLLFILLIIIICVIVKREIDKNKSDNK